jgi:hypothetical protein
MKNFKLIVKHQGIIKHEPEFDTLEEMQAHQALILEKNEWNFPTKEVVIPAWQETIPAKPEVLDAEGNVLEPAVPEYVVVHPEEIKQVPDVEFETIDNTAANESENVKKEKKHKDRGDRITEFKAIDWSKNLTQKQLQDIVKQLVKEAIKDDE